MKIFCSGIGGIGLSAYAAHMRSRGHHVAGSDQKPSIVTEDLCAMNIGVMYTQDGSGLDSDCDLLVYSEAIPESSPERMRARDLNIRQISYFQALGEITKDSEVICVCGTHGKSSTTAMVAKVFVDAGLDPNVVVGTRSIDLGNKNWRFSEKNLWIVEACEYRRSFHFLQPSIILMTNVDGDHFDAYKDIEDYQTAFVEFAQMLPEQGIIIGHGKDQDSISVALRAKRAFVSADAIEDVEVSVPGTHMRQNAALALRLAEEYGISEMHARESLKTFRGTWRRMEVKGTTKNGVVVIDDYAHHPVEIRASLSGLREEYGDKRIICVYQPHTHDRTLKLWDDFAVSFTDADVVILTSVYDARPQKSATLADTAALASAIQVGSKTDVRAVDGLDAALDEVASMNLMENDVIVTMGAGDITSLAPKFLLQ